MASKKKLLQAAAGSAGGAGLDVDEVFSTYLYDGTGSAQTITNGIDLSGEGGLVIQRGRNVAANTFFFDTERGATKYIMSASTNAQQTQSAALSAFNSDGFTTGTYSGTNGNGNDYVSWTFRKAPKFFDVVTYSGNGVSGRTISHNLGSVPGMIIIKCTNQSEDWLVYHRNSNANPEDYWLKLNGTNAASSASYWGNALPTSTEFTIGGNAGPINQTTGTYVAYLFAHNDGDGEFGPDSDQDIIKCGSYTGNGSSTGPEINLGFEPQWLMIKVATGTTDQWVIFDAMRGVATGGDDQRLFPNLSNAEAGGNDYIDFTSTGFKPTLGADLVNRNTSTYIYVAIRRGPLAEPTSATDVFAVDNGNSSDSDPTFISNFPVDMAIRKLTTGSSGFISSRLTWQLLNTDNTNAEGTGSTLAFDNMDGYEDFAAASTQYSWMWKRAPGYFDVVAYDGGNGSSINHNLGVTPEMYWIKCRSDGSTNRGWAVYHKDVTTQASKYLRLDTTDALISLGVFNNGTIDASTFSANNGYSIVNESGQTYIAYLFATVAGVSKVGSYTGTGAQQNIDCGFSSGARFVLIKRSSGTGHWRLMDSERGIVSGVDKTLLLNTTNAETTDEDTIDPHSSGFSVPNNADVNASGSTYIFYAIA